VRKIDKINETRTFKSVTTMLSDVREFVNSRALDFGFDEKEVSEITLAVDEACTNVIKHAYHGNPETEFEIKIIASGNEFEIVVRDWGNSFDPEKVPVPDIKEKIRKHTGGGLGIFLMRKLMDAVEYRGGSTVNEVRLIRYLRNELKA
jgi:serine/threonine-protein kinase RsbW